MTGTTAVAAVVLLAAVSVPRTDHGRLRLRGLTAPAPPTVPDGAAPVLRPLWLVVGCGAAGSVAWALAGPVLAAVTTGLAAGAGLLARRAAGSGADAEDRAEIASCWQLLAACLEAGLPVPAAVLASTPSLTGSAGHDLRRVAGLLALGADAASAWRSVEHRPALAAFARAAARSASTGTALARVARAEAERLRASLTDAAQARAQRAAVLITGPLGLCFLPAFLVLGVAPVVIGLANQALARW